uniref:Uncharacterized protein n=1 Tax=Mycena chlorophos TaxID=658473 RepID=A0ABQ0LWG3_MYCCL|nr:predicted protein [Mycena chlorophos]
MDSVRQNAAYHAQLLASIAELDYVPPALDEQRNMIRSLEQQVAKTVETIKVLEKKTKKERKEHEALRDSTARRFAAKITGRKEKFEAKASKEEREYIEALEHETQEKRRKESLEQLIVEAKRVKRDLESKLNRYKATKEDLATLYSKVFDGPTQAYPEDDRLESELSAAQNRYNEIQGFMNRESQAFHFLKSANESLQYCHREIQSALGYSTWDVFGGGAVSDMMERSALSSAEGHATTAATCVQQAQIASPHVRPIGDITIAHGSIITDVIFDNIFTDLMFHEKIEASARNLDGVRQNLAVELNLANGRMASVGADLSAAADTLARARQTLDNFRRSVFESVAGGMSIPALPTYEASAGPTTAPTGTHAPPAGPPPTAPAPTGYAPPAGAPPAPTPEITYTPPVGPPPSGSSSSAAWGSRNPYAAALIASPPPSPQRTPEKKLE